MGKLITAKTFAQRQRQRAEQTAADTLARRIAEQLDTPEAAKTAAILDGAAVPSPLRKAERAKQQGVLRVVRMAEVREGDTVSWLATVEGAQIMVEATDAAQALIALNDVCAQDPRQGPLYVEDSE